MNMIDEIFNYLDKFDSIQYKNLLIPILFKKISMDGNGEIELDSDLSYYDFSKRYGGISYAPIVLDKPKTDNPLNLDTVKEINGFSIEDFRFEVAPIHPTPTGIYRCHDCGFEGGKYSFEYWEEMYYDAWKVSECPECGSENYSFLKKKYSKDVIGKRYSVTLVFPKIMG